MFNVAISDLWAFGAVMRLGSSQQWSHASAAEWRVAWRGARKGTVDHDGADCVFISSTAALPWGRSLC